MTALMSMSTFIHVSVLRCLIARAGTFSSVALRPVDYRNQAAEAGISARLPATQLLVHTLHTAQKTRA